MRRLLLAGLVLFAAGCGPDAALWLRIEAPLVVPDQVDGLRVQVLRVSGDSVFGQTYDLSKGPAFPLTLTLTNDDSANLDTQGLSVTATALHSGSQASPCSQVSATAVLVRGLTTQLDLPMCESP